jgi:hypothetical protein
LTGQWRPRFGSDFSFQYVDNQLFHCEAAFAGDFSALLIDGFGKLNRSLHRENPVWMIAKASVADSVEMLRLEIAKAKEQCSVHVNKRSGGLSMRK